MANLTLSGQPKPSGNPAQQMANIQEDEIKRFGEVSERLRIIEERTKQIHEKVQVIDETNMRKINEISSKIKSLDEQLVSFRKDIEEGRENVRRLIKDMGQAAKLSDVRVLEKYINLVDITRLVTKEDISRYVEEYLEEVKHKKI